MGGRCRSGRPSGGLGGDEVADGLPFVIRDVLAVKAVLGSSACFRSRSVRLSLLWDAQRATPLGRLRESDGRPGLRLWWL
jgi:hypothetical protein